MSLKRSLSVSPETESLQISSYCRKNGLFPEDIKQWRDMFFDDRKTILALVDKAHKNGARLGKIFELVGISIRTYQRLLKSQEDKRKITIRPTPKNKLTFQEEQEILKIINSLKYQNHVTIILFHK